MKSVSKDIQKIKPYLSGLFKIINFHEGTGNEKGTVIWEVECLKNKKRSFKVKPKGTRDERRKLFENGSKYLGKMLKVYYFEIDNDGCVIRVKTGEIINK